MDTVLGLLLLVLIIFLMGLGYKNRHTVARWLNDTSLIITDENRRKFLQRRMEDDQEELQEIQQRLEKKKQEAS